MGYNARGSGAQGRQIDNMATAGMTTTGAKINGGQRDNGAKAALVGGNAAEP